jgi:cell division protein FtsZ
LIMEAADEDAEIIFGTVIDDTMGESIKVTVIATGLRGARKEINTTPARPTAPAYEEPVRTAASIIQPAVAAQPAPEVVQAPVQAAAPVTAPQVEVRPEVRPEIRPEVRPDVRYEARAELPVEAPVMKPNTDYAVKSEATFEYEEPKVAEKPKINWAEKLQNAASKYESQKNFEAPTRQAAPTHAPAPERQEYNHYDHSAPAETKPENTTQARESRIKSIAEKLGFFNFDEDEFDTPSFMKKNERNSDSQI